MTALGTKQLEKAARSGWQSWCYATPPRILAYQLKGYPMKAGVYYVSTHAVVETHRKVMRFACRSQPTLAAIQEQPSKRHGGSGYLRAGNEASPSGSSDIAPCHSSSCGDVKGRNETDAEPSFRNNPSLQLGPGVFVPAYAEFRRCLGKHA